MKLIDKLRIGVCGLMAAGGIAAATSFYLTVIPMVKMAKNPTEATDQALTKYANQLDTKKKIFYLGLGAMGLSALAAIPFDIYSLHEANKNLRRLKIK